MDYSPFNGREGNYILGSLLGSPLNYTSPSLQDPSELCTFLHETPTPPVNELHITRDDGETEETSAEELPIVQASTISSTTSSLSTSRRKTWGSTRTIVSRKNINMQILLIGADGKKRGKCPSRKYEDHDLLVSYIYCAPPSTPSKPRVLVPKRDIVEGDHYGKIPFIPVSDQDKKTRDSLMQQPLIRNEATLYYCNRFGKIIVKLEGSTIHIERKECLKTCHEIPRFYTGNGFHNYLLSRKHIHPGETLIMCVMPS